MFYLWLLAQCSRNLAVGKEIRVHIWVRFTDSTQDEVYEVPSSQRKHVDEMRKCYCSESCHERIRSWQGGVVSVVNSSRNVASWLLSDEGDIHGSRLPFPLKWLEGVVGINGIEWARLQVVDKTERMTVFEFKGRRCEEIISISL